MDDQISRIGAGTVTTELNFVRKNEASSFVNNDSHDGGTGQADDAWDKRSVQIHDIRGSEANYVLDRDAFEILHSVPSSTTYETFGLDDEIRMRYYPEVKDLLLKHLVNAQYVSVIGHGVRKANRADQKQPIHFVHVDHTNAVAESFAREFAEGVREQEDRKHLRRRIFSVWRPLNGPVESSPMAFMSAATLQPDDAFVVELRNADGKVDYFTGIKHQPHQKWYYCSGMRTDERILLQCTDSDPPAGHGVGSMAPHTAFSHPNTAAIAKPRESVEVRALVLG